MQNTVMPMTGILYHVTLSDRIVSIYEQGIDPAYSTGRLDASWYVNKSQIAWAILHTSIRHGAPVADIMVCAVLIEWKHMRRTSRPGRYYTAQTFTIESATPAAWYVDDMS